MVYGHAGNSAAAEPLRALGLCVAEIPTTLLSNAPMYPTTRGSVLPDGWFADLLRGADERGLPARASMLLCGFLGTVAHGEALADWVDHISPRCPHPRFGPDPVIGDTHAGVCVESGLEAIFRERLLPHAWLLMSNVFELGLLSGRACVREDECLAAARELLGAGPRWVVAHGIQHDPGTLVTLAVSAQASYRIVSSQLPIDVTGTGDVLATLLVGFLVRSESLPRAQKRRRWRTRCVERHSAGSVRRAGNPTGGTSGTGRYMHAIRRRCNRLSRMAIGLGVRR